MKKTSKYIAAIIAAAVMLSAMPISALAEEALSENGTAIEGVIDDESGSDETGNDENSSNGTDNGGDSYNENDDNDGDTDSEITAFSSEGDIISLADAGFSGSGSVEEPYKIESLADFKAFADIVNGGNDCIGTYFILTTDIDLGGGESSQWAPIGNSSTSFSGTFDGGGKTISGLYINDTDSSYLGLFGYNTGTIQNLTVSGTVKGKSYVGGIAGHNSGMISDCANECTVEGVVDNDTYVGGIVGYNSNGTIKNCYNTGAVNGIGNATDIGGIAGYNNGLIDNCSSTASSDVTGRDRVGGIVGKNSKDSPGGIVRYCSNAGKVSNHSYEGQNGSAGGIAGDNGYKVEYCYNIGSIEGNWNVGGVVGFNSENDGIKGEIYSCCNYKGSVDGKKGVGGVVGVNKGKTSKCFNTGNITGVDRVGGVVGDNSIGDTGSTTVNCYNTGAVTGETCVGGVAGFNSNKGTNSKGTRFGTLENCYNYGAVSGDEYVGGVVGRTLGENSNEDCAKVIKCYYLDTCGVEIGIGDKPDSDDTASLTEADFRDKTIFEDAGWDFGSGTIWIMSEKLGRPIFFGDSALPDDDTTEEEDKEPPAATETPATTEPTPRPTNPGNNTAFKDTASAENDGDKSSEDVSSSAQIFGDGDLLDDSGVKFAGLVMIAPIFLILAVVLKKRSKAKR